MVESEGGLVHGYGLAASQLKRLRDHPSIALWCGDNECIGALGWFPESKADRDRYLVAYDRLSQVLATAVAAPDPSRIFWPSSPSAGARSSRARAWSGSRR